MCETIPRSIPDLTIVHTRRPGPSLRSEIPRIFAGAMTKLQAQTDAVHRLVKLNYAIRVVAFAWSFLVVALHAQDHELGPSFWILSIVTLLAYPHLAYLRARLSPRPKHAELSNLY